MCSQGSPELLAFADAIERQKAELYHLRAGLAKVQADVDRLLASIESTFALSEGLDARLPTDDPDLTPEEARHQITEFDNLITSLEIAARIAMASQPSERGSGASADNTDDPLAEHAGSLATTLDTTIDTPELPAATTTELELAGADQLVDQEQAAAQDDIEVPAPQSPLDPSGVGSVIESPTIVIKPESLDAGDTCRSLARKSPDRPEKMILAAAAASRQTLRSMMVAATLAVVILGTHSVGTHLLPALTAPKLELLAMCGRAVVSGNVECASLLWSRL